MAAALAAGAMAGLPVLAAVRGPADVDSARIAAADSEPQNWMAVGRDYSEAHFSPLKAIDHGNVARDNACALVKRRVGFHRHCRAAVGWQRGQYRANAVGRTDRAGVADVVLEAAISTIVDFEDSVATVDADDKTAAYRTWLGLMHGTLSAEFEKSGRMMTRQLNTDRQYQGRDGSTLILGGGTDAQDEHTRQQTVTGEL